MSLPDNESKGRLLLTSLRRSETACFVSSRALAFQPSLRNIRAFLDVPHAFSGNQNLLLVVDLYALVEEVTSSSSERVFPQKFDQPNRRTPCWKQEGELPCEEKIHDLLW